MDEQKKQCFSLNANGRSERCRACADFEACRAALAARLETAPEPGFTAERINPDDYSGVEPGSLDSIRPRAGGR